MSQLLEIDHEKRVLRVVLNRPDKRNALNSALCHELVTALHHAESDRHIGAILLSANGPAFCAGMDLSEIGQGRALDDLKIHEVLFTAGTRVTKPIIAAVHGASLGGGMGVVANAHIAYITPDSTFGLTELRVGLWPFVVWKSVVLAVGERRAVELSLSARIFGAEEAVSYGLAQQIVRPDDLLNTALQTAHRIAEQSMSAVRSGLEFTYQIRDKGWREAGEFAMDFRREIFRSPDFLEGVAAFREKREPKWPSIE